MAKILQWGRIPQRTVKHVAQGDCRIGYIGGVARKTRSQTGIGNEARPARPHVHVCGFVSWLGRPGDGSLPSTLRPAPTGSSFLS